MSANVLLTITTHGPLALQDLQGLESLLPDTEFTAFAPDADQSLTLLIARSVYDRLRPMLRRLSQTRVLARDADGNPVTTGHTQPLLTYTLAPAPATPPAITQCSGAVTVSDPATLTLVGVGLIAGTAASRVHYVYPDGPNAGPAGTSRRSAPVAAFRVDAVAKGPGGNLIRYRIKPATAAAGSASITADPDGVVSITITPQTGATTASDIVSLFSGASAWVTATALSGSTQVGPTDVPTFRFGPGAAGQTAWANLEGGDGAGLARCDLMVSGTNPANRLQLVAQKPGSPSNDVSIILLGGQVGNDVTVSGKQITVTRIAATTAIGTLATAINNDAEAAALVKATAVGSGSLGDVAETWLYNGADEEVVATVGGAPAVISAYSDTGCTLDVLGADLDTAGVAAGETIAVSLTLNAERVSTFVVVGA